MLTHAVYSVLIYRLLFPWLDFAAGLGYSLLCTIDTGIRNAPGRNTVQGMSQMYLTVKLYFKGVMF